METTIPNDNTEELSPVYSLSLEFTDDQLKFKIMSTKLEKKNIHRKYQLNDCCISYFSVSDSGNIISVEVTGENYENIVSNLFTDFELHSKDNNVSTYLLNRASKYDVMIRFISLGEYKNLSDFCRVETMKHLYKLCRYIHKFCKTYRYELLIALTIAVSVSGRCFKC